MFRSALITTALLAAPAYAQDAPSGDAAAGESVFNQCQACHVVENGEGEVLAGRNGKVGPNLYGISGRTIGSVDGFRYSKSLASVGEEMDMAWDEEKFVGYVQDPTGWLKEVTDNSRARGNMAYKLRSDEDAANVWAYIVSLDPEAGS